MKTPAQGDHAPVSVVIPAYDCSAVLGRALESAMSQTLPPAQILVVDDGSSDGTAAVAEQYTPKVTCLRQNNGGVSAARNRGIQAARQDWVAFLDADDEWLPSKLERQLAILEARPDLSWCASNMEGATATAVGPFLVPPELEVLARQDLAVPFFSALSLGLPIQTSGLLVRRAVFDEVGLFDPSLRVAEDRDLWWRIGLRHSLLGYCPDALHRFYEEQDGSLTRTTPDRSPGLRVVCANLGRARALRSEASRAFEAYARELALDYFLREASREISILPEVRQQADLLFAPTTAERLLLMTVSLLPAALGRTLARAVTPHRRPRRVAG